MKRKEYLKPEMKVFLLKSNTPLLAGSTMNIYDGEEDKVGEGDIL